MFGYSKRGLSTRAAFYAAYNDVTIIVEDTTLENSYTRLFRRLLQDELVITRVLGVGGKEQVLHRFQERKANQSNREFYLLDGDFDALIGRSVPCHAHLYRLSRYDIESFLVDFEAIALVAEEQNPRHDAQSYLKKLDITAWQEDLLNSVPRLIACLVLLHSVGVGSVKGGSNIERFVSGNKSLPDIAKIEDFIRRNRDEQNHFDDDDFDRRLEAILRRMGESCTCLLRWVSGKEIVFPLLIRMLRRHTGHNISLDSLRFRLIGYCRLDALSELRERILRLKI